MDLVIILVIVFLVSKWLITTFFLSIFKVDKKPEKSDTVINYNITNNHLHINEDDFNKLKK